jgi:hypothetical protein
VLSDCPCTQAKNAEGWHRYRNTPMCLQGRVLRREQSRAKYARKVTRAGRSYTPMAPRVHVDVTDTDEL